ncbi:hypothetical protein [Robiginitalea marina]|uniref:Uncharacterized protein n=1 Tax=Robiginitalea marina TaxID=2954105 RepID=A0ABT1B104_9FLAO|nr:hypothetical protein [Robiginitalea marina]MCO5725547.1 hypothetical protein [Robiginitalea marina]
MQRVRQQQERAELLREKFIEACENLNARIIEPHLEEEDVFMGLDKYRFLAFIQKHFEQAKKANRGKLVMVKKYCGACHPNNSTMEFYFRTKEPIDYKIMPYSKELVEYRKHPKPVFAFAIIKDTPEQFDVDFCQGSWGFQAGGRFKDRYELRLKIYGEAD